MAFQLRPYQQEAVNTGVSYLTSSTNKNAILILPTGSGKSVVIANLVAPLEGKTIILQPSKEILEQNFAKYSSYGYQASIYSASAGQKKVNKVTFCTIGSIINKKQQNEEIEFTTDAIYLYCPNGYGKTKLNNNFLENKLKVNATTRNWKTINELLNLTIK